MKAEIFHYNNWLMEINPEQLRPKLHKMLEESGFWVITVSDHHFDPTGYTCMWMLGESHLALHTFPEEGYSYLELSSCNAQMHQKFVELLEAHYRVSDKKEIGKYSPKTKSVH